MYEHRFSEEIAFLNSFCPGSTSTELAAAAAGRVFGEDFTSAARSKAVAAAAERENERQRRIPPTSALSL